MPELRLVIAGAGGRMGRTLLRAVHEVPGFALAGAVDRQGAAEIGADTGTLAGLPPSGIKVTSDASPLVGQADAIIDFTSPDSSIALAGLAAGAGIVHVIGTTGMSKEDDAKLEAAARQATIVKSGNMSLGVNLLAALVKRAAASLGPEFDIEILEIHHNRKVDAPSGTGLLLGKAAADGRKIDLEKHSVRSRDGHTGARRVGDIGFATLRGGTVVGDHTVIFAGPSERIELTHKAEDRMIFARGALAAAKWGKGKKPGMYSMADVLGLD
ncbi:MAG: 4-hydroxy-tetrahydrodipicolinate reductase [Rhizobiales bacterium]|nr:4-hydroxy-tetrahydrodipicolinate reductase [Hyphomicrobiales bacterium]